MNYQSSNFQSEGSWNEKLWNVKKENVLLKLKPYFYRFFNLHVAQKSEEAKSYS